LTYLKIGAVQQALSSTKAVGEKQRKSPAIIQVLTQAATIKGDKRKREAEKGWCRER
jgi:hypothetical protein